MDMQVPYNVRTVRRVDPVIEARNRAICARYAAGETLAAIGDSFDISAERVRKILKKLGLDKTNAGLATRNLNKPCKPAVEPYCVRVYGCSAGELEKFTLAERQAYLQQKTNVRRTDVQWRLTLPEWSGVWFRSGKWAQRGRGARKYGLCRIDSSGAFSAENVLILRNSRSARGHLKAANQLPNLEFSREAWILARLQAAWTENRRIGPGIAADAMQRSVKPKYWDYISTGVDPELFDRAEIPEK